MRLRRSAEFTAVREHGETSQGRFLRVTVLRISESDEPARLGIVTSRKVGAAVERNRIRRKLREIFRLQQSEIERGTWIVVVAKRGAGDADYGTLREEWLRLAKRLSIVPGSQ